MEKICIGDLKPMFKNEIYNWESDDKRKLYVSIVTNGYISNFNRNSVLITKDNYIIDGNHRSQILKRIYSDDYQIKVKRWSIKRNNYLKLLIFFLIIFSPFSKNCRRAIYKILKYKF